MGSVIEINDTLQITKEQGFPEELDINQHLKIPFHVADFLGKVYEFKNKPKVRNYQMPPVRNFLVENVNGKWVYWGLIHVLEIHHDYLSQTTSGKYKIVYLNSPEEMRMAAKIIDAGSEHNYFVVKEISSGDRQE